MSIHRQANDYPRFMRSRSPVHASAWRAPALGALLLALGCGAPAPDIERLGQRQAPLASNVAALLDFSSPDTAPFPNDQHTRDELRNLTGRRVHLPKPNCSQRPTDCQDIDVLNTLDGFSLQPRLRIPFNGAIDPSSVSSSTVFLVQRGGNPPNTVIGINQVVWDPSSNTLFVQPDQLLAQHTRYLLIITTGIRDTQGSAIGAGNFTPFPDDPICTIGSFPVGQTDPCTYRARVLSEINAAGFNPSQVAAANTFTTQSVTAVLEKIRQQIKSATPAPAVFTLPADGSRAVYPLNTLSNIVFNRQTGTSPPQATPLPLQALNVVPNSVSSIAFGRYSSPDYETAQQFIPAYDTGSGIPVVQRNNDIFFNLFLPAGPKPAGGWPVALFGHGFGDTKQGASVVVASVLASQGIATIVINVVGHGGGSAGTLVVNRNGQPAVTLPAGGRGIDQNGDGVIELTEGVNAAPPQQIIARRDGHRQTVVDLMQLARVIETGGVDVDGDGGADLNGQRIYYFGQSFGGIYGTILMAVEPSVRAGVLNVAGGSVSDAARLGIFRSLPAQMLATRTPSLLNAPPVAPPLFGFNESLPLRNQPPLINNVPGAIEIQEFLDRLQWVEQPGDCVAYATHIRKQPLSGVAAKPIIVQIAKGDGTVPNPTNSALIRAGDLTDRTTYFRNDLAFAADPTIPKNPHTFLTNLTIPASAPLAVATQAQIATFLASDGTLTNDPDGAGALFETPIIGPLPETLNLLP
jgi:hypothetical protein